MVTAGNVLSKTLGMISGGRMTVNNQDCSLDLQLANETPVGRYPFLDEATSIRFPSRQCRLSHEHTVWVDFSRQSRYIRDCASKTLGIADRHRYWIV